MVIAEHETTIKFKLLFIDQSYLQWQENLFCLVINVKTQVRDLIVKICLNIHSNLIIEETSR